MKRIIKLFILIIIYCSATFVHAQQIEGRVITSENKPIEFANVTLLNTDSTYLTGTTSDRNGNFLLKVPIGKYILKASFIGYNPKYINCQTNHVGDIVLSENTQLLKEVVIKANKPLISQKENKTVYNVKNMENIQGMKATDILHYVPLLSVSETDGIKVANSPATVFVNDRKLSQAEAREYLRNMNADEISTIEIQKIRSAEYGADIQGGIISIRTKGILTGISGSTQLYAAAPRSHYYSMNPNSNVYWGTKNWNIYGSYSYEQSRMLQYSETNNQFLQTKEIHKAETHYIGHSGTHNYKLGSMFQLGKKHLLMVEINGINIKPYKEDYSLSSIYRQNETAGLSDRGISYTNYQYQSNYYNAAASYKWDIDTKGSFLKILANYNNKDVTSINQIRTTYQQNPSNNIEETDDTHSSSDSYSIQGDFKKHMKHFSFLMGSSFVHSNRKSDLHTITGNASKHDSRWDYSENILAAYIGANKQFGDKFFYASLRVENTDIKGVSSNTADNGIKKNYTDWIPYLYFSYTPTRNTAYMVAYTRTLYRPPFALMNNYTNRISDILYDKGNPNLKSSLTDVIQLQWVHKKHTLLFTYKHTSDEIMEYFEAKDGITYHTNLNYGSIDYGSMGYYYGDKITPWWQTNIGISGDYTYIPKSYNVSHLWRANLSFSNRLLLSQIGDFSVIIKGYTNSISGNAYRKGYITADVNYSRSFIGKKLNLRIGIDDLFNCIKNRSHTYVPTLDYDFYSKNQTRKAWISLTYSFWNKKEVSKDRIKNENAIMNRL